MCRDLIAKAGSVDTEALLKTFDDMKFETISGPVTMRGIDKQATMGAWVGETTLKGKVGAMKNWRFADGANYMFSEAEVRAARKG
jgi:branched-chain amino acid transport system substrate-binding protein